MSGRITQDHDFGAPPTRVYDVLTSGEEFASMTGGAPAELDGTTGAAFSCFGGMITGRNLECEPGVRLVQAWRAANWDPGVYSVVRFELADADGSTRLHLDHAGFPDGQDEHLGAGWEENYWAPLRRRLAEV